MMGLDPSMLAQLLQGMQQRSRDRDDNSSEGNSRKYRMERVGSMSDTPLPYSIVSTTNPAMPLRFEMEEGWASNTMIGIEAQGITAYFEQDYVNKAVMKAHIAALESYSCYDPSAAAAAAAARAALRISDLCPEAYNVLALSSARDYDEALEMYKKGVELGTKVLKPGLFEEAVKQRELWGKSPYRAYYRALYGVANTLRKMKRYSESLEIYDQLMKVDPNWYHFSSYVNVFATYPLALLEAKGPEATRQWFHKNNKVSDQFTYISSSLYYAATYALVELEISAATGHGVGKEGAAVTADDNWAADGLDLISTKADMSPWDGAKAGRSLFVLCMHYPDAVDMLLGDKASPKAMVPLTRGGVASVDVCGAYVCTAGHHWRSRPVALERLRRYRNTMELRCLLTDLMRRLPISTSDIKQYITAPGGIHVNALDREGGDFRDRGVVRNLVESLCCVVDGKDFSKDQLKVLKWLLDAGCPIYNKHRDRPNDSPLHMACYQGYGPECVKLLLAAGADVFDTNPQRMTPLKMSANQGNWREMQALLEIKPELKTTSIVKLGLRLTDTMFRRLPSSAFIPEALLLLLFETSCLICVEGGERCMRCSNGVPHSKYADFFKYAEVVISQCGLTELSKQAVQEMEKIVRKTGVRSLWGRLHKHVMTRVSAAAAAAKASSGSTGGSADGAVSCKDAVAALPSSTAAAAGSSSKGTAAAAAAETDVDKLVRQQQGKKFCWCCAAAAAASGKKLKVCSGCKKAKYCSAACQNEDWKRHKTQCKIWTAEKESGGAAA